MELTNEDVRVLKDLITALEISRMDVLTQRAVLGSEMLGEKIKAAKKVLQWGEGDEKTEKELRVKIEEEVIGQKTIKGKYESLKKILKAGSVLLVGIAAGATGAIVVQKSIAKKNGAEKK